LLMTKFGRGFFKKLDSEEEYKATVAHLESEEACRRVASLYGQYVHKWSRRDAFFLSKRLTEAKKQKRLAQIRKLIRIVADLGIPMEVYIKAQFEEQMPFLRTRKLTYVPFANLISQRAIDRFKQYKKRIDSSYGTETRREEFYSTDTLKIRKAVQESMKEFYECLKEIKDAGILSMNVALKELETMARARMVSNIYIFVSPIASFPSSTYLSELRSTVAQKLNDFEKKEAIRVRKEVLEELDDQEMSEYV